MQCDWFEERLYGMVDTSALPRISDRLSRQEVLQAINVPKYFDIQNIDRNKKRKRKRSTNVNAGKGNARNSPTVPENGEIASGNHNGVRDINNTCKLKITSFPKRISADQDNPPSFLYPLQSRQRYTTSWEKSVPFISSYVNSEELPTLCFQHRPRIGRGGRVIIDRVPRYNGSSIRPNNVYISGMGMKLVDANKKIEEVPTRMLDLLPEPLDYRYISRRIEQISASALYEDENYTKDESSITPSVPPSLATTTGTSAPLDDIENNRSQHILVNLDEWIETDEQLWGPEISILDEV